jgi:glycosyltransferase involved in cell wall biosynthesis
MSISVVITTYGTDHWKDLAWSRAFPSVADQITDEDEILVEHYPDLSIGPARNKAAAKAEKNWLLFLDADDELAPGYLQAMREATFLASGTNLYQPAVQWVRRGVRRKPYLIAPKDLREDNYLVIGTLVSRSLFKHAGGFSDYPHGFEDWSLWAKCWRAGAQVIPVPTAIYIAHVNPNSAHKTRWRDRREQVATHLRVRAELFPEHA